MPSMQLRRDDVIVGVDTHKDEHVAVAARRTRRPARRTVHPCHPAGFAQLLAFCREHVGPTAGSSRSASRAPAPTASGWPASCAAHGYTVHEVHRPPRKGERRLSGKSDTIDAEHAARQVLAGRRSRGPEDRRRRGRGVTAAQDRPRHRGEGPDQRHDHAQGDPGHRRRRAARRARAADRLQARSPPAPPSTAAASSTDPDAAMRHVLRSLARRWLELHEEIKTHSRHLKAQTKAAAPRLVEAVGVGLDIAAEMLVTAGDNTDRIRSEAAFAKLCGACPIPAGSGKTNGRHRLNRGGNRQANAALYRADHRPHALAPTHHRLRRPPHRRGPVQTRDHPLPQALPRPRDLPTCSRHRRRLARLAAIHSSSRLSDLRSIGASTPWPSP